MRIARCYYTSKIFHVMVQGIRKERIFNENYLKEKYINLLKEIGGEHGVSILAYCVMNNHAHILVYVDDTKKLTKMMHSLNMRYANKYNKIKQRCGYVFRNRYRCENITAVDYLKNCIRYIHNNPVKANICVKSNNYHYSSYREYIENKMELNIIKEILGEDIQFLFDDSDVHEKYTFLESEDEFEENDDFSIESVISEYCYQNNTSLKDLSYSKMSELVKLLVNKYKIPKKEIQNLLKLSKYMTYKFLR